MSEKILLGVFDVAGTTVIDDGLVIESFFDAADKYSEDNYDRSEYLQIVTRTMGERKIDVFESIYGKGEKAQLAHNAFIDSYLSRVKRGEVASVPGVEYLFRDLQKQGVQIALNTGFPRQILDQIISVLEWRTFIDFSIAASEVKLGRPAPDMINNLIYQYNSQLDTVITANNVTVIGDTVADITAGKAANAKNVIGILSGIHSREKLMAAGADDVIENLNDVKKYF